MLELYKKGNNTDIQSVLLSQDGYVIRSSKHNIGYRTAFYTPRDGSANEMVDGQARGKDDMVYLDIDEHRLWGPIEGAEIGGVAHNVATTFSDREGRFKAHRLSGCYVTAYPMAKLRYGVFDPQGKFPGHYQIVHQWLPDCQWMPECENLGDGLAAGPTLAGQMTGVAIKAQCAENNIINGMAYLLRSKILS